MIKSTNGDKKMEFLAKIERKVLEWVQGIPHLPKAARQWLGDNIWWLTAILTVIFGIVAVAFVMTLIGNLVGLAQPYRPFIGYETVAIWSLITTTISLLFVVTSCLLLGAAVSPLKEKQKKGWVLLFAVLLINAIGLVVTSVLTIDPMSFILNVMFGALVLAITGYILLEIHGQFAHVERSKGVKAKAKKDASV